MQGEHTPGPWFFGQTESQAGLSGHGQWTVAIGKCENGDLTGCRKDEYMSLSGYCKAADAALMSAAPDLLAALIELAGGHSMAGEEMARKAIAKATGGER